MQPIPFARISPIQGINVLEDSAMDHRAVFLEAMHKKNPRLYQFLARTNPELLHLHGMDGLGAAATAPAAHTSWWQDMLSSVAKALPMGITAYQEIALSKAQVQNAVQGKPPINMQPYIQSSTPTATVSVGVQPGTQKTILYVAGGLGVILLIAMMNGSRSKPKARA